MFRRKDPHHEIKALPGKPTLVFITLGIERLTSPWVASPVVHALLCTLWTELHAWSVSDYVLMPDHLHFFAYPGDADYPLQQWMAYWKRRFHRVHANPTHRFQTDYWDVTIRSHAHYTEQFTYMRLNPVRKGLVTDPDAWTYQGTIHDFTWIEH